jgi:excisionase family DNA binding protein
MADPRRTSQPGLSIHEAAVMLGVSPNTVRRWCSNGRLRSERVKRPQGEMIRVFVDRNTGQVPTDVPDGEVPGNVPIEVPPPHQEQASDDRARAEAMVSLIRTTIGTVLGPMVAQLDAHRQMVEHAQGQIVWQAEMIGRLTAERDAARAELEALKAQHRTSPDA